MKKLFALALAAAACCLPARAQDTTASETVRRAIHVCAACHGDSGRAADPGVPALAGQTPLYLQQQLKDFRSQARSEANLKAYMWGVSALLDDDTITGLAAYYAALPPRPGHPGPSTRVAAGRKIYEQGLPLRGVKACADCHGANAEGQAGFPRLAGQHAAYVASQLQVFRSTPLRPHGVLMKSELRGLTAAEMRAVAAYVESR
jgi:cytochrome c553